MASRVEEIREARRPGLIFAVLSYGTLILLLNLVLHGPAKESLANLERITNGWLGGQLVLPLATFWAASYGIFGIARLRGKDIGWRMSDVAPALVVTLLFWLTLQGTLWLGGHAGDAEPVLDTWQGYEAGGLTPLVVQLVGNAFVEETFFRGYLLPQIALRASGVVHKSLAWSAAILVSTGLFALFHWPWLFAELRGAGVASGLLWEFGFGLMLAALYLVTRNLFVCIGLHSLFNRPTLLVVVPREDFERVWWMCAGLLLVGWTVARILSSRRRGAPAPVGS